MEKRVRYRMTTHKSPIRHVVKTHKRKVSSKVIVVRQHLRGHGTKNVKTGMSALTTKNSILNRLHKLDMELYEVRKLESDKRHDRDFYIKEEIDEIVSKLFKNLRSVEQMIALRSQYPSVPTANWRGIKLSSYVRESMNHEIDGLKAHIKWKRREIEEKEKRKHVKKVSVIRIVGVQTGDDDLINAPTKEDGAMIYIEKLLKPNQREAYDATSAIVGKPTRANALKWLNTYPASEHSIGGVDMIVEQISVCEKAAPKSNRMKNISEYGDEDVKQEFFDTGRRTRSE